MAKNDYLKRQADRNKAFFDAGERVGMQKCWDYVQIALRDQDVMGKDVIGRKRMERYSTGPRILRTTSQSLSPPM